MRKLIRILTILRHKSKPATIAKERLQIIVAHEKNATDANQLNLPLLKQELLAVIAKYITIDEKQINVQLERDANHSVLELNITIPNNN